MCTHHFVVYPRRLSRATCQDGQVSPHPRPVNFSALFRRYRRPGHQPPSAERHRTTIRNICSHQAVRFNWYLCRANVHRQCRHALARTRSTPSDRHTPSDRQVPFGRRGTSRLTRYTLSDRRGLRRQETYFHGGCSGEAPGALAGRLVRSILPTTPRPSTAIVQVGRTSARPRARPWPHATGRHPFALPKPRSPTRQPRDSVGSMGARSGRCGQRRPCGCS